MRGDALKTLFLVAAIAAALYCAHRGDQLEKQAHDISEEISTKRGGYVGDTAGTKADKVVESLEKDRDRLAGKSEEMNHLFTYVISGFLGLAISVAADLLGQRDRSVVPQVKAQVAE